jgi:translation initiation factor 1 (eIF-1/SUI1)
MLLNKVVSFLKMLANNSVLKREPLTQACPYCGVSLEKKPQRKKKCPECKEIIYVKRQPNSKEKELVTKEESDLFEMEWDKLHKKHEFDDLIKNNNITTKELKEHRISGISNDDFLWSIMMERLLVFAQKGDWHTVSHIYFEQALIIVKKGKDPYEFLYESNKASLKELRKMGAKTVKISTTISNGCNSCIELEGKEMSIATALRNMPLPHKSCTNDVFETGQSWCRCTWVAK